MNCYSIPIFRLKLVREKRVNFFNGQTPLKNSLDVVKFTTRYLKDSPVEQFLTFYLDNQNRLIGLMTQKGTVNQTAVYFGEIFKTALLCNSVSLILVHNHPSGMLKPSPEDIRLTGQIKDAARLFQMSILDHLIIDGVGGYLSFHEKGIL